MEKIIRLSENKLMVFYDLPIILTEASYRWSDADVREIGVGIQKTKIRYKIDGDKLNDFDLKSKFWKILKAKYDKKFDYSSYALEKNEEETKVSFEGREYTIVTPKHISITTSKESIEEYIIDNRFDQIDTLL